MMKKPCRAHSGLGGILLGMGLAFAAVVGIAALCKTKMGKKMMQKAKEMKDACADKCADVSACLQTTFQNGASTDTAETAPAFYSTKDDVPHVTSTCYDDDIHTGVPRRDTESQTAVKENQKPKKA